MHPSDRLQLLLMCVCCMQAFFGDMKDVDRDNEVNRCVRTNDTRLVCSQLQLPVCRACCVLLTKQQLCLPAQAGSLQPARRAAMPTDVAEQQHAWHPSCLWHTVSSFKGSRHQRLGCYRTLPGATAVQKYACILTAYRLYHICTAAHANSKALVPNTGSNLDFWHQPI
jgi:hypothetical protein